MKIEPSELAQLLRRLAAIIAPMNADEFKQFIDRAGAVSRLPSGVDKFVRPARALNPEETSQIVARLQAARTREEGTVILRSLKLTRRQLWEVARARSIHVAKEDSASRIEEKLVEAIIGSRLNSDAIRGTDARDKP